MRTSRPALRLPCTRLKEEQFPIASVHEGRRHRRTAMRSPVIDRVATAAPSRRGNWMRRRGRLVRAAFGRPPGAERTRSTESGATGQGRRWAGTLCPRGSSCVTSLRLAPVSDRERDALVVDDEVVLAARPCAADRAGPAFGPLRAARVCEESITTRDQSSGFFAQLSSSTTCSWSQTPASFQATRRRQQVMSEPKPSSWGRYSPWMPVCRTKRIPHRACRSGTRGLPSTRFGPGCGSNGSMSAHSSSDTTHRRD